jgi:hypothetical protein
MSTIINARSPYYLKYTKSGEQIERVEFRIYIWSGLLSAVPTTVTYTLEKIPLVAETDNNVVIEISQLIRDYLYTDYYTDAQDAVWVRVEDDIYDGDEIPTSNNQTFLAFDGFGDFEEGANPRQSTDPTQSSYTPMVLQSNMTVYFISGRDIKIPVFSETAAIVTTDIADGKWDGNDNFWNEVNIAWQNVDNDLTITDSNNSADKIQYVILTSEGAETGDTITFTSTVGNSQTQVVTLVEICEPRFDKYRSVFYNKFGALQSFWLTKKSVITTNVKDEKYQSNLIDASGSSVTYNIRKHNKKRFQVLANQLITTNTPLLKENQNEPLEQLLVSEQVWLEETQDNALPVVIRTSNLQRKTGVNDKAMIQYSLDFEYAFNKINDIR